MAYYYHKITTSFLLFGLVLPLANANEQGIDVVISTAPDMRFAFSYMPLLKKEPTLDKHSFDALSQTASLLKAGNVSGAIAELKIAIAQKNNPALWYSLAQIQQQNKDYQSAQASLRQALVLQPGFARAQQALGALLVRDGEHDEARVYLTQSLSSAPSAYVYSLIGYGYLQQKNYLAAQMAYQNAIVLDAKHVQYQRGLLQSALASNDTSLAQAVLDNLLAADPDDSKLWQLKANLALKQQRLSAATSALEVAEKLKSKIENRRLLAQIYLKQQQFKLAQPYLMSLLDNASYTDMQLISNAVVFMTNSAPEVQVELLMSAMWKVKNLQPTVKSQLYFTQAQFALQKQNVTQAKKALGQSIELDSQNGDALLLLARLLEKSAPMKSELLYRRAGDIDTYRIRAKVAHAQLLIVQKGYTRAYDLLREVQNLEPNERKHSENLALVARLIATNQS